MDPALRELQKGDAAEDVEAIVKLRLSGDAPEDLRLVAIFDNIATCRLKRGKIQEVWADEAVASLKAPRLIDPDLEIDPPAAEEPLPGDPSEPSPAPDKRRPDDLPVTGSGVVVGIVDWGCDFAHPNFLNPDETTRLLALWDQGARGGDKEPAPYGYGAVYNKDDINQALREPHPYEALGYHPADSDFQEGGCHGTHVLDIAAGNGRAAGSPSGIAPEADIVFVQLATHSTGGLANLGDSVRILEAIDFIAQTAKDRPVVINLSVGRTGGPHDGKTLVEQGMDAFVKLKPGRAIVQSAGNYFNANTHTAGQVYPGHSRQLAWVTDKADITPNELEVWYSGNDSFMLEVFLPGSNEPLVVPLGQNKSILVNEGEVGRIYHRKHDPNNGGNHIDIFLDTKAPAGEWQIRLMGEDIIDGRFHAWVERDSGCRRCQSRFIPEEAVSTSTIGTIANGLQTITTGAYDPHSPEMELAHFSSSGPTADGRQKPNLVAPGVDIIAARSAPRERESETALLTRKSGTSMAAPHVTGTVALMFEAAIRPLDISETRKLLLGNTQKYNNAGEDEARTGSGYLDISRTVEAASQIRQQDFAGKVKKEVNVNVNNNKLEETHQENLNDPIFREENSEPQECNECGEYDELLPGEDEDWEDETVYPTMETMGTAFVNRADETVSSSRAETTSDSLLGLVLPKAGLYFSPAEIFDSFAHDTRPGVRRYLENSFQVIAFPGEQLKENLHSGDILVRRALGEENLAQLSILVTGIPVRYEYLESEALSPESSRDGLYVHVIEAFPFKKNIRTHFARRLASPEGYIGPGHLVLRLKTGEVSTPVITRYPTPDIMVETVYTPSGGRTYTPSTNAANFNCAPNPVGVTPATHLPDSSTTPDADIRTALGALGLSAAQIAHFQTRNGYVHLRPIAAKFGAVPLEELLRRLRYTPQQILSPPHTYGTQLQNRLGFAHSAPILAVRLLLCIPGHFRELARRAPNAQEAFALENLGWLLMRSLKSDIAAATNYNWWLPPDPLFVTYFANTLPQLSPAVHRLIMRWLFIDTTKIYADYRARFNYWDTGLAGRHWRLETGLTASTQGAGRPFYSQVANIPAVVNITPQRTVINAAWATRVAQTPNTADLGRCAQNYATYGMPTNYIQRASFQGLEMLYHYPARVGARPRTNTRVLSAIRQVFERLFETIYQLGWNDLIFQTSGSFCFRAIRGGSTTLSNHGSGTAIDINAFENARAAGNNGSMDPRIVALFEAFNFRWGRCFTTADPMHFEYI